jgi:DNA polymerase-4
LQRLGLRTIGDVAKMDISRMRHYLGSLADHLYWLAQGLDERPVEPHREAKSIGQETTFAQDVRDVAFLETTLLAQVETIARRLRRKGIEGRTVTLKLRYAPFRTITRSHTLPSPTALENTLFQTVKLLLAKCGLTRDDPIRLIGVSVAQFSTAGESQQLSLFDDIQSDAKQQDLSKVVDLLKDKFGENVLTRARLVRKDKPADD